MGEVAELERLVSELAEGLERLEELHRRILRRINGLNPLGCTLDYRWVKNGAKQRYCCYYYCIRYENGKRKVSYVGKDLNREYLLKAVRDKVEYRRLSRALRKLDRARMEAYRALRKAEALLARALARVDQAVSRAESVLPPEEAREEAPVEVRG